MAFLYLATILCVCVVLCLSKPDSQSPRAPIANNRKRVIDSPERHPAQWKKGLRSNPNKKIDLTFAIKQQHVDELYTQLMEVSTPSHLNYGRHLTSAEIHSLLSPTDEALSTVKQWLMSHGFADTDIRSLTLNDDFVRVSTTIGMAETMLGTTYHDYENDQMPQRIVSRVNHDSDYSVPEDLAQYLDFVSPTKRFPSPRILPSVRPLHALNSKHKNNHKKKNSQKDDDDDVDSDGSTVTYVTPAVLKALYNVGDVVGVSSDNSQGICSFIGQYFEDTDLASFWTEFALTETAAADVERLPADQPEGYGAEAELDVQYITGMGNGIATQVLYTSDEDDPFLAALLSIIGDEDRAALWSISYGEDEVAVGEDYAARMNVEFAKLGTMGVSVFVASGDSGAGTDCATSASSSASLSMGGTGTGIRSSSESAECPVFPASSPYVTAVGGVTGTSPEVAWEDSGGGFSNYFARPTWQTEAASTYVSELLTADSVTCEWNSAGRGYPDVAAQAVEFVIAYEAQWEAVSGTSCASPTVAGIFALLNDVRYQNDMSPLGFVNPFIYLYSDAFNDVTEGSNIGCGGDVYSAATGWDAVTGLGTPDYAKLVTYVKSTGVVVNKKKQKHNHWIMTLAGALM